MGLVDLKSWFFVAFFLHDWNECGKIYNFNFLSQNHILNWILFSKEMEKAWHLLFHRILKNVYYSFFYLFFAQVIRSFTGEIMDESRLEELRNRKSINQSLANVADLEQQEEYFNRAEKKEAMEEKMINTKEIEAK